MREFNRLLKIAVRQPFLCLSTVYHRTISEAACYASEHGQGRGIWKQATLAVYGGGKLGHNLYTCLLQGLVDCDQTILNVSAIVVSCGNGSHV